MQTVNGNFVDQQARGGSRHGSLCGMANGKKASPVKRHREENYRARGNKILINVSGARYQTYEETLNRYPETLLGCKERRDKFYDQESDELFFDRNRICFESILAYYQTYGVLIRPPMIPEQVFVNDIEFFGLGEDALFQAGVEKSDNEQADEGWKKSMPKNRLQRKIWELFEYPETSNTAKVVAIVSVSVIIISIVLFCVETLPQFQHQAPNGTKIIPEEKGNRTRESSSENFDLKKAFFLAEAVCISWFSFEYLIRFLCSPNKWKFFISVLNVIDLVSILPFFITLSVQGESSESVSSLAILRCIRLVRVFRIFKLSRYSRGLQILGQTFKASVRELGLLLFFLCVGIILFSSAVYYAELGNVENNEFESIPHSFWWAIITMTTVGYGDMAPNTLAGKFVGSMCAVTGVLAIALPVPVIVSNFAFYYSREQSKATQSDSKKTREFGVSGRKSGAAELNCLGDIGVRNRGRRRRKKRENLDQNSNNVGLEQEMDHRQEDAFDAEKHTSTDEEVKLDERKAKANTRKRNKKKTPVQRSVVSNGVETAPNSDRETIV